MTEIQAKVRKISLLSNCFRNNREKEVAMKFVVLLCSNEVLPQSLDFLSRVLCGRGWFGCGFGVILDRLSHGTCHAHHQYYRDPLHFRASHQQSRV